MPLRNMWSLEPGEVLVAEEILKKIPECDVYFPLYDIGLFGVDLLLVSSNRHCSIQVKESRYYNEKSWHSSWHQVSVANLDFNTTSKRKTADFFVFLTYVPDSGKTKIASFNHFYIIVPFNELKMRAMSKKDSKGMYSFCFSFENKTVKEIRENSVDYTSYWDNWKLIKLALSVP